MYEVSCLYCLFSLILLFSCLKARAVSKQRSLSVKDVLLISIAPIYIPWAVGLYFFKAKIFS